MGEGGAKAKFKKKVRKLILNFQWGGVSKPNEATVGRLLLDINLRNNTINRDTRRNVREVKDSNDSGRNNLSFSSYCHNSVSLSLNSTTVFPTLLNTESV